MESRIRTLGATALVTFCLFGPNLAARPAGAAPRSSTTFQLLPQSPISPEAAGRSIHGLHLMAVRGSQSAVRNGAATPAQLTFHGGVSSVAIEATPKVYVVFYGNQWGNATTVNGNLTFSGDPKKVAPRVQVFLRGLYGSENWSTSTTQYCDGLGIGAGRIQCGTSGRHIKHPTASPLAGVWYDNASSAVAAPSEATIRASAVRAARHFGNTTPAVNASVQYVIVSPHGIVPTGFGSQYCAYHSSGISSVGTIVYTNLPYIPDAGAGCGQNLVNAGSAGTLDGVTLVEGHEYAEVLTDQFPPTGWLDSSGAENGDKCAWITSGAGKGANTTFPTGRFAVQSLWSNNANGNRGGCVIFYNTASSQG